jgi:probable rRNA maturation factor
LSTIYFHSEEISFELSNQPSYVDWIFSFITAHEFRCGNLNFVFCSDDYLLEINRAHLSHDYYTDVITFNYVEDDVLAGDIFISIDRVEDNAKLSRNFAEELRRVMAHGVLHLIGFNDKSDEEKGQMTEAENNCLKMYNTQHIK